ncbi:hypothetical protein C8Q74DRAFT_490241 [Fomes fomentarius]|nr:hypothetical protein C8Q74DRAFT_490241 [Fomes fomentarius]
MVDTLLPDLQNEPTVLLLSLEGLERARYLCIAATFLILYDMALTIGDEVEYFWKGSWTPSRILYFLPVESILSSRSINTLHTGLLWPEPVRRGDCSGLIHTTFLCTIFAVGVVQAVIVLRICYVYSKNNVARFSMIGCFVACTISTLVIYGLVWHDIDPVALDLPGLKLTGCSAPPSREVWKVFAPNLVLHTILYLATTIPAFDMRRRGKKSQLMDRLVRDGGALYSTIFAAAMFSTVGSLARTPLVTIPAVYSNLLPALASVAVSRLMLSIRSLAAQLSLEPDWLLNHTELGRVNWKPGSRDGELIVEIDNGDDDVELTTVEEDSPTSKRVYAPVLSRVGVLEHSVYPGTRDYKPPPRTRKKPNHGRVGFSNVPPLYEPRPIHHDPTLLI